MTTAERLFFNELKFCIQAYVTIIKVEFVDEVDPMNCFEMAVVSHNSPPLQNFRDINSYGSHIMN